MQSFKQFLKEEEFKSEFTTRRQVEEWVKQSSYFKLDIHQDLTISAEDFYISNKTYLPKGKLPVKIEEIRADLDFSNTRHLKSLLGCPEEIGGYFNVGGCRNLKSLKYIPKSAYAYTLGDCGVVNYKDIHKFIIELNDSNSRGPKTIKINPFTDPKSPMLGFLKIKNLKSINADAIPDANDLPEIMHIINKHLKGDKDILSCQEELIENGFKENAKF